MMCRVELANEMSGLSGTVKSDMAGCGREADCTNRFRLQRRIGELLFLAQDRN